MTLLDTDTFTRSNTAGNTTISNAAGWGAASGGSAWSSDNGTYTFSILSNTGKVTGDVLTNTMYLGSTTSTDGDIKVRIKQDHAGDRAGVTLRRSASGTFYRAELINGTTLSLFKNVSGTTSQIGSNVTFNYTTSQLCWIRFKLRGSSLAAKAWLDGNSEPDWMITATDTSVTVAGNFGLNVKLNAAGDVVEFDSLTINDLNTAYTEQAEHTYFTKCSLTSRTRSTAKTRFSGLSEYAREFFYTKAKKVTSTQVTFINNSQRGIVLRTIHRFLIRYMNQLDYADTLTTIDGTDVFTGIDGTDSLTGIG